MGAIRRGAFSGASIIKFTPQRGRVLDTRRLFETGRSLDHLRHANHW